MWLCGPMVCSYVAMWLYGYVAVWLCGSVDMWLCSYHKKLTFIDRILFIIHSFIVNQVAIDGQFIEQSPCRFVTKPPNLLPVRTSRSSMEFRFRIFANSSFSSCSPCLLVSPKKVVGCRGESVC